MLALCPDALRLQRLCEHLIALAAEKHGLPKGTRPEVLRVNAAELNKQSWRALKEDLTALSLFSSHSITQLDHIEKFTAEFGRELTALAPELPASTTIILSGASLPAQSALLKFFRGKKWVVELEELKGAELAKWTQKELKSQGGFAQGDAAVTTMLADLAEDSPDRIAKLIEMLSLYCESSRVSANEVRELFPDRAHANEFHLVDALIRGDQKTLLGELDNAVRLGKSPLSLLGLLARNLNTLLSIVSLRQQGLPEGRIRERLNLPDWLYRKHMSAASSLDASSIAKISAALLRADSKCKNASLGDEAIFTELFDRIRVR